MSRVVATCSICFEDLLRTSPPATERRRRSTRRKRKAVQEQKKDGEEEEVVDHPLSSSSSSLSAAPCGHVFHTRCVRQWTQERRHCPQCRRPVAGDGGDEGAGGLVRLFLSGDDGGGDGGGSGGGEVREEKEEEQVEAAAAAAAAVTFRERLLASEREREEGKIIQVRLANYAFELELICSTSTRNSHLFFFILKNLILSWCA